LTNVQFIFNVKDKSALLYSLLLRNLQKKKASLVFCRNQSEIKELSQNLWINSGINFLPHAVNKQCKNESIILSNDKIDWMDDTLINFSSSMVDGFNRYLNLIELVTDDEKTKEKARNRFKIYKDYGYKVNSIDEKNLTINYL
jgi:DNA polymerase-3 subunit chi|tara:strand:+ start:1921 stop:2349 length:429 start_codon:yes stop_codon:yes gene_type:complete